MHSLIWEIQVIHYGFELKVRPRKGWQTIAELPGSLMLIAWGVFNILMISNHH
jgi:hypothetical protein